MPYDLYWGSNDPEILREFYEADKLRQQRENNNAWLAGAYVAKAVESTICNAFLKKGESPAEYPANPIDVIKKEKTEAEIQEKKEQEAVFARAYMMQMVEAGKNWGKH